MEPYAKSLARPEQHPPGEPAQPGYGRRRQGIRPNDPSSYSDEPAISPV